LRLRGPDGDPRRQLRALPGARRRDASEHAHHRAGAGPDPRRGGHAAHTAQAAGPAPGRPVMGDHPRYLLAPKPEVYNSIEGLMDHFMLVIEGSKVPAGEVYVATEGGNGELGVYLVSDGSGRP